MSRMVRLSALTDREKDSTILVLSGLAREQRALLEDLSSKSYYAKRKLDELTQVYQTRLGFLERIYVREDEENVLARQARRNDGFWDRLEVPS